MEGVLEKKYIHNKNPPGYKVLLISKFVKLHR